MFLCWCCLDILLYWLHQRGLFQNYFWPTNDWICSLSASISPLNTWLISIRCYWMSDIRHGHPCPFLLCSHSILASLLRMEIVQEAGFTRWDDSKAFVSLCESLWAPHQFAPIHSTQHCGLHKKKKKKSWNVCQAMPSIFDKPNAIFCF